MSDPEIATLAGLTAGLSPERIKELSDRVPDYQAKHDAEDAYLEGLSAAANLLEAEHCEDAAHRVRELLGVAARYLLRSRSQYERIQSEIHSPDFRRWMEEESPRVLSGELVTYPFEDLLTRMEQTIAKDHAEKGELMRQMQ